MSNGSTQLTIRDRLNSKEFLEQLAAVLPKHVTPERMARVAMTALLRTPDLANCYQPSFFKCMFDLSQWGLEPDGRHAHLIPFRNNKEQRIECQLILDYKGIVQLALHNPDIASISADVVCANDEFVVDLKQIKRHVVNYRAARGEMYAAWSIATLKDGRTVGEVMTKDEIESIRARSKASDKGPWVTDYNEMAKKTVFRRLSKWLPLSAEIRDAMEADFDSFGDEHLASSSQRRERPKNLESLTSVFEPKEVEVAQSQETQEVAQEA